MPALKQQNKEGNFSYHSKNKFCFWVGVVICCKINLPSKKRQIDPLWQNLAPTNRYKTPYVK